MKKFLLLVFIIAGIAGGAYYWKYTKDAAAEETPKQRIVKAECGPIFSIVDTTGKVVSNRDVEIKCKASGQVVKLPFEVSDLVKEGDLLVELDPLDEQRNLQQSEVTQASSKAKLAQARHNLLIAETKLATNKKKAAADLKSAEARAADSSSKLKRLKDLLQKKLTSQQDYDATEATAIEADSNLEQAKITVEELRAEEMGLELKRQDVNLAEAQVKSDAIDLSKAMQRVSDTKVFAPIDGVLSERKVQIGQIISSGISNVGGGTSILTISDLSRIFVVASVDESDIGQVQLGQKTAITTDAFTDRPFRGEVVLIATKGVSTANVVTFEVKIEVLGFNKMLLKPEMTANVKIIAAQRDNAVLVPSEAVYHKGVDRDMFAKVAMSREQEREHPDKAPEATERPPVPETVTNDKPPQEGQQEPETKADTDKKPERPNIQEGGEEPKFPRRRGGFRNREGHFNQGKGNSLMPRYRSRKNFVLVSLPQGKTEEREVEVGINDGVKTEIVKGLKEGEEVVIEKGFAQSRWQNDTKPMKGRMMMGGRGPH